MRPASEAGRLADLLVVEGGVLERRSKPTGRDAGGIIRASMMAGFQPTVLPEP
jgi:hypothetical protein